MELTLPYKPVRDYWEYPDLYLELSRFAVVVVDRWATACRGPTINENQREPTTTNDKKPVKAV